MKSCTSMVKKRVLYRVILIIKVFIRFRGSNQSIFLCHNHWIICVDSIIEELKNKSSNWLKIEIAKLRKPRCFTGISFWVVLPFSASFSVSHGTHNDLCIHVFCESESIMESLETRYAVTAPSIFFWLLEINSLSSKHPTESVDNLGGCVYFFLSCWKSSSPVAQMLKSLIGSDIRSCSKKSSVLH